MPATPAPMTMMSACSGMASSTGRGFGIPGVRRRIGPEPGRSAAIARRRGVADGAPRERVGVLGHLQSVPGLVNARVPELEDGLGCLVQVLALEHPRFCQLLNAPGRGRLTGADLAPQGHERSVT